MSRFLHTSLTVLPEILQEVLDLLQRRPEVVGNLRSQDVRSGVFSDHVAVRLWRSLGR